MVAEKILLGGFYCATAGSVLLLGSIIWSLIRQWSSISHNDKSIAVDLEPSDVEVRLIRGRTDFRGYDSPELFEEDLILRTEKIQHRIRHYTRKRRT